MDLLYTLVTEYDLDRDIATVPGEIREQVDLVRDGGFDGIRLGEHHATPDAQFLLNEAVLSFVAASSGDLDVATGLCLLPYHNPVRIAEYGATMDVLTGGHFTLGVGQGYRQEEFDVFGVDRRAAGGRLREGVEVITRLWTEDSVTFRGDHFGFEDVTINPKPLQDPRPPVWVGGNAERSIRRAARIGDGWWGAFDPFDDVLANAETFRDERNDDPGTVGVSREVFVGETDEAAAAAVKEVLVEKYANYTDWGQAEFGTERDLDEAWESLREDRFIVGSPDTVVDELERYADAGIDFVAVRMNYPGMPFETSRPSVELFCDEVVPRLGD